MIVLHAMPREGEILRVLSHEVERRAYSDARFYLGRIRNQGLLFGSTGIGQAKAGRAVRYAIESFRPDSVMVIGFCGAVSKSLAVSDLVIPDSVTTGEGTVKRTDPSLSAEIWKQAESVLADVPWGRSFRPRLATGSFITVDQMVTSREQAERLASRGISCCDMEMFPIVEACNQAGIPVSGLKVVTDVPATGASGPRYRIGHALASAIAILVATGSTEPNPSHEEVMVKWT